MSVKNKRIRLAAVMGLIVLAISTANAAPNLASCGKRNCGDWKKNGDNNCRTCKTTMCETRNGQLFIKGIKTEKECEVSASQPGRTGGVRPLITAPVLKTVP